MIKILRNIREPEVCQGHPIDGATEFVAKQKGSNTWFVRTVIVPYWWSFLLVLAERKKFALGHHSGDWHDVSANHIYFFVYFRAILWPMLSASSCSTTDVGCSYGLLDPIRSQKTCGTLLRRSY